MTKQQLSEETLVNTIEEAKDFFEREDVNEVMRQASMLHNKLANYALEKTDWESQYDAKQPSEHLLEKAVKHGGFLYGVELAISWGKREKPIKYDWSDED